jgi:dihydroflavonol-4-reductase
LRKKPRSRLASNDLYPPADENYRMQPSDVYQRKKAQAELWIRDFAVQTGMPLTVVRPVGIYGPGDTRLFKLFKMAGKGWFPLIGHGQGLYHLIHVEDLTEFMIHAANHPQTIGEVFLCGNPTSIALKDLIQIMGKGFGHSVHFVRIPEGPLFLIAGICEAICKPLHLKPPIFKRRVSFFTKDRAFNTQKMMRVAGFIPRYTYEEGVLQTLDWYFQHGWLKGKKNIVFTTPTEQAA